MFNPLSLITGGGVSNYIIMGLAAVILIGGGLSWWYYKDSQNTIRILNENAATLEANNNTLKGAIQDQNNTILTMENQRKIDQVKLDRLSVEYKTSRSKVNNLRRTLSKHDIGYLAQEKPGLVEKIVNKGTREVGKRLESLSQPNTEVPNE